MDPLYAVLAPLYQRTTRTNADLARAVGVSDSLITRYRDGSRSPSLPTMRALLTALEATPSEVMAAERAWLDRQAMRGAA